MHKSRDKLPDIKPEQNMKSANHVKDSCGVVHKRLCMSPAYNVNTHKISSNSD